MICIFSPSCLVTGPEVFEAVFSPSPGPAQHLVDVETDVFSPIWLRVYSCSLQAWVHCACLAKKMLYLTSSLLSQSQRNTFTVTVSLLVLRECIQFTIEHVWWMTWILYAKWINESSVRSYKFWYEGINVASCYWISDVQICKQMSLTTHTNAMHKFFKVGNAAVN